MRTLRAVALALAAAGALAAPAPAAGALAAPAPTAGALAAPALAVGAPAALTRATAADPRPWPITITIQTVPAMPGVRFTIDGTRLTTDARGRASYTKRHNFDAHTLTVVDTLVSTPQRRYAFARWAGQRDPDQAFRPTVTGLPMRASYTVTAAFTVLYPVSASYVDQSGRPVDPARVTLATVRGDDGTLIDLPSAGVVWLAGQTPTYRKSTLRVQEVSYTLQRVLVSGADVALGRQRFAPATTPRPVFTTQFHDLTVRAHDAIFGTRRGAGATVTYPDGRQAFVPFGADGTATLTDLPRGTYRVDVPGAGTALTQQVRLSRARAVDVIVVSPLDLATVGGLGLLVAGGLLLVGRAGLRRRIRRGARRLLRRPPSEPARQDAPDDETADERAAVTTG
jgi:hypothetical protein